MYFKWRYCMIHSITSSDYLTSSEIGSTRKKNLDMADANINNREPNLENVQNQLQEATLSNGETGNQPTDDEGTERKITQTDHLNKRLLAAFLDRINVQGPQSELPQAEPAESEEWEDSSTQREEDKET